MTANHELAAEDLDQLTEPALSEDTDRLRRLLDGLEGEWLRRLAAVDAHGAAGADQDQPALSTASWLRHRQRMGTGVARGTVRTARALFGGPLPETAALTAGDISLTHAREIAEGTRGLPSMCSSTPTRSWPSWPDAWTHPSYAGPLPSAPGG